jgi:uncharacterized protein YozE (UPF0346 family)
MKLIEGTEVIDNSPNEKAGELAEAIFDDVVFILDLEDKCIAENEDGSYNTELGQELFDGIFEQCKFYFEKEV